MTTATLVKLLYTPEQGAAALSLSRSKVYALMLSGELAFIHVGRCRRVSADALQSFVTNKQQAGR